MTMLFFSFYLIFLLIVVILAMFVVYHIHKYNTNPSFAKLQIIIFLAVAITLIVITTVLFFMLPFETMDGFDINFFSLPRY